MQNFLSVKVNVHWIGMASSGFHASIVLSNQGASLLPWTLFSIHILSCYSSPYF